MWLSEIMWTYFFWGFSLLNNVWENLTDTFTPNMRGHTAVWDPDNSAALIFGGQRGDGCRAFSVVYTNYVYNIHICVHTHTHIIQIHKYIYANIFMCVYIYIYSYICIHMCTHVHTHTYIYIFIFTHIFDNYIYIYIHMCTHTHIYIYK